MIPSITAVRMSGAATRGELPLLVLGPSLGTPAAASWTDCAAGLTDSFDVLAWDLPGHGHNRGVPAKGFTMAELAAGVLRVVDDVLAHRDELGGTFAYAGSGVGGAVGLQLLLDAPDRIWSAVLLGTGACSVGRASREGRGDDVVDEGHALVAAALADFDVRDRLAEITAPVLAVAGSQDTGTPAADLEAVADGVQDGRVELLEGGAAPLAVEAPAQVAALIRHHVLGEALPLDAGASSERHVAGLAVQREVLGDAHVDRAAAATTDLTRDFEMLATEYAWGGVWARPGLDRRSRSLIALTALVAGGHLDELEVQLLAARTNGLSDAEISECLLQTAVYCGMPAAGAAYRIAQRVLAT